MNFGDVIKLTVNGYSPDEIRDLKKISNDSSEILEYAKSGKSLDEVKSIIELTGELMTEAPAEGRKEPAESAQTPPDNSNDKLIEENEELKKQIKQLQTQNQFTDQSGNNSEDPLADFKSLVADCM